MMVELSNWITEHQLKQADAAQILMVSRPRVSDVVNQKTAKFTIDTLIEIEKADWRLARVNGSHHVFTHELRAGIVVVPHPKKDLGKGLIKAIRKQAGI